MRGDVDVITEYRHQQTKEYNGINRKELGMSGEISAAVGKVWLEYFDFLSSGSEDDSVYYEIGKRFLIAHGLKNDDKRITHEFIDQLLSGFRSEWNRYFLKLDPSLFYNRIRIPVLAIFGSDDKQTSVEQNLIPLNIALSLAGNKAFRIVVLADEDHFFLRYNDQRLTKHKKGEMQVSERLLTLIVEWLSLKGII